MSTRLQVVMDESELRKFRKAAKNNGITLSEWVRSALRRALMVEGGGSQSRKLAAVRAAARHVFPAPDIEQMLDEIVRGYSLWDES